MNPDDTPPAGLPSLGQEWYRSARLLREALDRMTFNLAADPDGQLRLFARMLESKRGSRRGGTLRRLP